MAPHQRREHSSSTTRDVGGQFVCVRGDSVAVLDMGATASLACFKWLAGHNSHLQQIEIPQVSRYPKMPRVQFGDRRIGEVRYAADINVRTVGRRGTLTACVPEAAVPALLRKGAREALGGRLDFARGVLAIWIRGVEIPLEVNEMGHYLLSVFALGNGPSCVDRGPKLAASYSEWAILDKRPDLSNGGLHLPFSEDGLRRLEPPRVFSACAAATLGGTRDKSASDMHRRSSGDDCRRMRMVATLT